MNHSPPAFHIMCKPRGAVCNLDCEYCFYLKKEALYAESDFRMSFEVLESFTRQYIAAQRTREVNFTWQGGEPLLMGLEFYQQALALQEKYKSPGIRINNSIQTNGTLLDNAWCTFFKENNFLVGLSLDGPVEVHDVFRKDKSGNGTFTSAMRGLRLLQKHKVEYNVLTCVQAANVERPLEVYHFLRDEAKVHFMQFIPIIEWDEQKQQISHSSISGEQYGHFLNTIFDEWLENDLGNIFVQLFETTLGIWNGGPASLCAFSPTCGTAMALEHNGDLYSCDHYVDAQHYLGNLMEIKLIDLVSSEKQRQFGVQKAVLPKDCLECDVCFLCNGGCPKNRFAQTQWGEKGLNLLCQGYKDFFHHTAKPMLKVLKLIHRGYSSDEIMAKA